MAYNKLQYAHGENVSDTAPNSIGSGDTSITVNTISKWNSNGGPIVINRGASDQEYAVASGVSGSSLTISQRGAYGSSAVAHNANATIESVPFATQWNDMLTGIINALKQSDGTLDVVKLTGGLYAADTGSANAYAIALGSAPTSYATGLLVAFKAANANTTTSTLNVNSLGTKTIKKLDGSTNLAANDIVSGQICVCVYDGTNFQLISAGVNFTSITLTTPTINGAIAGTSWAADKAPTALYAADTGSANAYAVTLSPAPAAYVAGMVVRFKAANANTTTSTLNVNSLGAKTINKLDGATALVANDIKASQLVVCVYDGTNFQMQSPVGQTSSASINFATSGPQANFSSSANSNVDVTGATVTINPSGTVTVHAVVTGRFYTSGSNGNIHLKLLIDGTAIQEFDVNPTTTGVGIPFAVSGQKSVSSGARVIKLQTNSNSGSVTVNIDQANVSVVWG